MTNIMSTPESVNYRYYPVGSSEKVQKDLSNKIAGLLALNNSGATLEELGFLGSTVLSDRSGNRLVVKLMFHPDLVAKKIRSDHTGEAHFELKSAMENLSNHMFVGSVASEYVTSYERCRVPKHRIKTLTLDNGKEKRVLKLKYDENNQVAKETVETDCIVITCNPNLVFACLVDTSLQDPNYEIHVEPVKRQAKTARPNAEESLVPAQVTVTCSTKDANLRYDGGEAIPYLKSLAVNRNSKEKMRREISRKAREDAEDKPKKLDKAKNNIRGKDKKLSKFGNL